VPDVLLIAHRMPATAEACSSLLDAGATMFEVDVQYTSGGIVVSHYLPVPGTGGRLRQDGWRVRWGRLDGRDPLLGAHLDAVPRSVRILLDPKDPVRAHRVALIDTIIATLGDRTRFVVSTGGLEDLSRLRAAGFETWRSIGDRNTVDRAIRGDEADYDGVTVRHNLLDRATVAALHERFPTVVAWTVNSVGRGAALRQAGVDGITTDSAAVLRSLAQGEQPPTP
jgi:glycerophosphoryl diester phosphodiesterase